LLEAMACGTPVVTANVAALPEVAGDAALLVDPTSVDQIAAAMKQIVSNTALRGQLRAKGLAQAARYPWRATCSKVLALLEKAAQTNQKGQAIMHPS
jgi:glycosyltransferase involved in cell wall biosynthesis